MFSRVKKISASLFEGDVSHQFPFGVVSGNFVTLMFVILTSNGVTCVSQLVPVYPCGQSQPQSGVEVPPFKHEMGTQGVSPESEEQLKNKKAMVRTDNHDKTVFIIFLFSRP
jgi:hypothetical protein